MAVQQEAEEEEEENTDQVEEAPLTKRSAAQTVGKLHNIIHNQNEPGLSAFVDLMELRHKQEMDGQKKIIDKLDDLKAR